MSLPNQVKLLGQHHFQFVVYVERTEWHINAIQKAENVDNVKKKGGWPLQLKSCITIIMYSENDIMHFL